MADPKSIHEFTSGEGALGSLFLMDSPDQQASSGYTTEKLAMTDLGDFLNNEMEYTQDLDTEDKKISGALNELHGVDGFDVYDETTTSANKYEQGDICIHNNTLQVCTSAAGAYGAWDSTKWSPTTIKALLALKQNSTDNSLTTTNKQIVPAINELKSGKQDALNKGSIINVDLNTLKSNGVYFVNGSGTALNAPTNTYYGILEVVAAYVILQRSTNLGPEGTGVTQYERIFINNAWTSWKKITRNIT